MLNEALYTWDFDNKPPEIQLNSIKQKSMMGETSTINPNLCCPILFSASNMISQFPLIYHKIDI